MRRRALPLLLAAALALPACSSSVGSDRVLETLETVATLRGGTVSALRDLRGIFVEPVAGNLYILTKEALYQHPMPN